jgi:hypothetical protein
MIFRNETGKRVQLNARTEDKAIAIQRLAREALKVARYRISILKEIVNEKRSPVQSHERTASPGQASDEKRTRPRKSNRAVSPDTTSRTKGQRQEQ